MTYNLNVAVALLNDLTGGILRLGHIINDNKANEDEFEVSYLTHIL